MACEYRVGAFFFLLSDVASELRLLIRTASLVRRHTRHGPAFFENYSLSDCCARKPFALSPVHNELANGVAGHLCSPV